MIKVIDGKRYNTDTAEEIHNWSYGFTGDFDYRSKTLYRTQKGAWFIHHEGGAMTDMSVKTGNNSVGGSESIEPISEEEAFDFLQEYDGVDAIEEYFHDRVSDA